MSTSWKITVLLLAAFLSVAVGGIVGGPSKADPNAQLVKDALQFAVVQHNLASNAMFSSKVTKIIDVQQQVVSGMKYIFKVEMARTSCRKGGAEELECPVHADAAIAKPSECTLEVWSQPWMGFMKLVKNTCKA